MVDTAVSNKFKAEVRGRDADNIIYLYKRIKHEPLANKIHILGLQGATSGTKGAVSNLELNYDPSNATKDGYFTTTSPYPIYISQSDIASGQELDVPINGIGEGLEGDNTKPAMIHLKYNSDKTMTISHEEGYVNDGSSAGATGANYSFVVEIVATFSTQKAVAQFPESIKLFSGSTRTDKANILTLDGASDYYENVSDGLLINLKKYAYTLYDNQEHG